MKQLEILFAAALLFAASAVAQIPTPDSGATVAYWQQPSEQGPESAPPPDVLFRTQAAGGRFATSFFAIANSSKPVIGAPYTATAITETTQVLADGNRIVNKSTALLARDNQGRTRREETMGALGPLPVKAPRMAFISDPIANANYVLDLNARTAHVVKTDGEVLARQVPDGPEGTFHKRVVVTRAGGPGLGMDQTIAFVGAANEAGDVKTQSLGTQVIEGVAAEGKRVTRIIPAGQIGNERPLVITSEVWTSPDLQMVVLSKRNDPRFGETVYRVTDINRAEPDASLFEVPAGFSVDNGPPLPPPR